MKYISLSRVIFVLGVLGKKVTEEERIVLFELQQHVDSKFVLFRTRRGKNVLQHVKQTCEKKHNCFIPMKDIQFILKKMGIVYRYFQSENQQEKTKLEELSSSNESLYSWLKILRHVGPLSEYFLTEVNEEIEETKNDISSSIKKIIEEE